MKVTRTGAEEYVARARDGAGLLAVLTPTEKANLLEALSSALIAQTEVILEANRRDVEAARSGGSRPALLDRLQLTSRRIQSVADGVRQVARLEDPVGSIEGMSRRPNEMLVGRMRVPIGVILMIYEARPNVTIDAAALCLKAGSAVILRGGSEAQHTNSALASVIDQVGLPGGAVQVVCDPDRSLVVDLLRAEGIDLAIPRGSEPLIRVVTEYARMPVLKHFKGVCHLYVDRYADLEAAIALLLDGKTSRPSTCNAVETLLVDGAIAQQWLPRAVRILREHHVEVRGCDETTAMCPDVLAATEDDWAAEYLDLILSIRVVDGLEGALDHIHRYSTGLAEAIVTEDRRRAMRFLRAVDSAAVLVNASTRLVDGEVFGLGSEIGISTDRLGPRGPMGLRELTTAKWVVLGTGQVRG